MEIIKLEYSSKKKFLDKFRAQQSVSFCTHFAKKYPHVVIITT